MTRLTTNACPESTAERASIEIARALERARAERGVAHLALSGGSTPARTYELLTDALEDWDAIEIWFADERCVAPEDEESNFRLADETLLIPAGIDPARVHRMEGELGAQEGARRYAEVLRASFATDQTSPPSAPALPALDLIVLGIGPDGHVASLFPGAPALDAEAQAICLGVLDSPKPPPERITLSLAMLRAARRCLLLATGAGKADAIAAALAEPTRHVPASLLVRERLTVIVDDAASPTPVQR
jgi:6-phosphogluconolactonase